MQSTTLELQYQNLNMGLVATTLLIVTIIIAVLAYIWKENKEKEELRVLLAKFIDQKETAFKSAEKVGSAAGPSSVPQTNNEVYLKQQVDNQEIRTSAKNSIYKIVITGGPCGGKSTSLTKINEDLTAKGFRVFSVPEIPTLVVQAGGMILMSKFSMQERIRFQSLLIRFQMYAEDYFTRLAEMSKMPCIILCDRGTVDPAAYVSKDEFQAIMDEEGWTWTTLRDRRYDRVIHLTTAAIGAEEFYTLSNNNARHEGVDLARSLDKKTLDAWTGHPHITVCPNVKGESFNVKIDRAIRAVYETVGLEIKNNRYQKFLISKPDFPVELKTEVAENEQIFLINDDKKWSEDKIKRRGQNNSYTYQRKYRSFKNEQGDYSQQVRIPLTSLQYVELKEEKADPKFRPTKRERVHFIIDSTHYSVDIYENIYGQEKTYILRFANAENVDPKTLVPSFIKIEKDVRGDAKYELKSIAKIE